MTPMDAFMLGAVGGASLVSCGALLILHIGDLLSARRKRAELRAAVRAFRFRVRT